MNDKQTEGVSPETLPVEPGADRESGVQRCQGCFYWLAINPGDFRDVRDREWGVCEFRHTRIIWLEKAGMFVTKPSFGCVEFSPAIQFTGQGFSPKTGSKG